MRFCSIASGSSGNCIYVGDEHTHVLVDTGISKKRIEEGLKDLDVKGDELDGIFITHEHADHIQGLGVFSRKYGIPIYATKGLSFVRWMRARVNEAICTSVLKNWRNQR